MPALPAQLAYRFVLSAPGVTTVVGGFSSPEHTREATDAASKGPLGPDVVRAIHAAWYAGAPG